MHDHPGYDSGGAAARILVHARGKLAPDEVAFWERLHRALAARNRELFLIAHNRPQVPTDVPILRVPNGCDRVPLAGWDEGWRRRLAGDAQAPEDTETLLAREALWWGADGADAQLVRRRRALAFFETFYASALQAIQPSLVLIWNGMHAQEMILARLSRRAGAAVQFIERAPFQGFIHLDREGILGGSQAARLRTWEWPDADARRHWQGVLEQVAARSRGGGPTWWHQPDAMGRDRVRARCGIRPGDHVVLFPGQVDADAQNAFYAPHFVDNAAALDWFSSQLADHEQVFLLGKHHPMSSCQPATFRQALRCRGCWVDDVSLQDCLAVTDGIAGVNSSVLYDGLLLEKPVLSMGESLLSGKGICYELNPGDDTRRVIADWLAGVDNAARLARWHDWGAWLLANCFYAMATDVPRGCRGADELAAALAASQATTMDYTRLHAAWGFWEEVSCLADREADQRIPRQVRRGGLAARLRGWR